MLHFTGIQSYSYTEQRKVETDVDRITGIELATLPIKRPHANRLSYVCFWNRRPWSYIAESNWRVAQLTREHLVSGSEHQGEKETTLKNVPPISIHSFFFLSSQRHVNLPFIIFLVKGVSLRWIFNFGSNNFCIWLISFLKRRFISSLSNDLDDSQNN